jgi:hypothetical protein
MLCFVEFSDITRANITQRDNRITRENKNRTENCVVFCNALKVPVFGKLSLLHLLTFLIQFFLIMISRQTEKTSTSLLFSLLLYS